MLVIELGCGGSGGSSSSAPVQNTSPDFTLATNPANTSVVAGYSVTTSLTATAENGFSSQINVQTTSMPTGISIAPASITLTPGNAQQITVTAAPNAPAASGTITFTGTSGSLSHSAQLSLSVSAALSSSAPSRTRYIRTDSIAPNSIIYNPNTTRFFMTDPYGNQVVVLDAKTESKIGSINVPGANGIDDTPDHNTLYVGTLIGDVYAIDVASLTVTHRYLASQIGPYGYQATSTLVLADGRLALLGAQGGIPSVDGSSSFAIWSPTTNSISVSGSVFYGGPHLPGCVENIGGFTRSADRTKIFIGSIDSDSTLCEVDESTGQQTSVTAVGEFSTTNIVTSPDGNYLALPGNSGQVALYDANTLNLLSQFNISGGAGFSGFVFSADSKTLFVPNASIVYAYNIATQQQTAWGPNIAIGPGFFSGSYQAVDGTGLFAGPTEEGVAFFDSSSMMTGPVGTQFYAEPPPVPATGPVTGGTQVQVSSPPATGSQAIVYFGSQTGSFVSRTGNLATVSTPPGLPGPADVYAYATDGGVAIFPEVFSYGPSILEVTPNASTVEGGGTGVIYGYGFASTTATSIPSSLQITVGGKPASILGLEPNAYGILDPPFPLQAVGYVIPAGSIGPVDVTVASSSGNATAQGALTYLPALQQFSLTGASLAQGIYDPHRNLYYFTDANKVQVFSKSQGMWLSPIGIPGPSGKVQRLWALALSPDGSKLAISDIVADVIYVLNPSNAGSVQTFAVPPPIPSEPTEFIANPAGLAISDAGIVYYTTWVEGGTGFSSYFKLDTNSGVITDYHIDGPQLYDTSTSPPTPLDPNLRTTISADNSRVFFNNDGNVFSIDTATDIIFQGAVGPGCCYGDYDLTLSANQTSFEATSYLYDSDLNGESFISLNDREALNTLYVYGAKLSPDGSLLFQPSVSGIDVLDGRIGTLRTRIALPVNLSTNYDALVADGLDNILIAITGETGSGIAIVDLTSLGEPSPLAYTSEVLARSTRIAAPQSRSISETRSRTTISQATQQPRGIRHVTGSYAVRRTTLVP